MSWSPSDADAYFARNPGIMDIAPPEYPILQMLSHIQLPERGEMVDVGGAAGRVAAGFINLYPMWRGTVLDISPMATRAGRATFPALRFCVGSIIECVPRSMAGDGLYDLVKVSSVLCYLNRRDLSRAIANIDVSVRDGGVLLFSDFACSFPRRNSFAHHDSLHVYKQDYLQCFMSLGIYDLQAYSVFQMESGYDPTDVYDRQRIIAVLRKDLSGKYAHNE